MSAKNYLINMLEACEKTEFDQFVRIYLIEEYGFSKIVFTDGKDDTGLDIKIFDFNNIKIQYQLTIQKSKSQQEKNSFEKKLFEDLEKSNVNYKNYNYSNKLIFFYSKTLTNKKIREYEKIARIKYEIDLDLIEGNRLAEDSLNYKNLQNLLLSFSGIDKNGKLFENKQENLIYDLLSFGNPSDFKMQIIESSILQQLYISQKMLKEEIISLGTEKFNINEDNIFYDRLISKLMTSKRILKLTNSEEYILSNVEQELLEYKNNQFTLEESHFVENIREILNIFNQDTSVNDYVLQLQKLYVKNFNSDLNELINQSDSPRLFGLVDEFMSFVKSKLKDEKASKDLAIKLLCYCANSKFIQKIAASKVYCDNIGSYKNLQKYLLNTKKIFIDTQIALYALCYFYSPKNNYDDFFYKMSKNLILFSQSKKIKLFMSHRYLWEVTNHIKEARNLMPFTRLPNFDKLGSSRNVFLNFYLYLINSAEIDSDFTFDKFMIKFNLLDSLSSKSTESKIENYLSSVNIGIQSWQKTYNIEETNILFENALLFNNRNKTSFSLQNDSIMVEYLSDTDIEVHQLEPVFVSWDKSFFKVHEQYFKNFPSANRWLIIDPAKLVDAYALLNFSINSETVTDSLLALISDDVIVNTHSFLDNISTILNVEDEVGLEYTNKIAKIREDELNRANSFTYHLSDHSESNVFIDELFYKLTTHYQLQANKIGLFKEIFTKRSLVEDVISTIKSTLDNYHKTRSFDQILFANFDKFISIVEADHKNNV
jgi:hypothetical protein